MPGVHGKKSFWRGVGRKGWQRVRLPVSEKLAKGWRRVGTGLANGWQCLAQGWRRVGSAWHRVGEGSAKNASFSLPVEVFLLTVHLFIHGGGTASKKDQIQFPDGGNRKKRPSPISGQGEP